MKLLWLFGIHLLYCSMVNSVQQDCIVYDVNVGLKKELWSGDEISFFAFVGKDDVVNIEISYEELDKSEFFTTIYFSPSTTYSKIKETKYGIDYYGNLKAMKKANVWVEFKISSHKKTINVFCEPNIEDYIIPINQTSNTFSGLVIKASNRSACTDERKWELFEGNRETIPLGEDQIYKSFYLKIDPTDNIHPYLLINNSTVEHLLSSEYNLTIEGTQVTWRPLTTPSENNFTYNLLHNLLTLDMISKDGNVTVSVFFETKPPSLQIPRDVGIIINYGCLIYDNFQISYLIFALVIMTICVGLCCRFKWDKKLFSMIKGKGPKNDTRTVAGSTEDIGVSEAAQEVETLVELDDLAESVPAAATEENIVEKVNKLTSLVMNADMKETEDKTKMDESDYSELHHKSVSSFGSVSRPTMTTNIGNQDIGEDIRNKNMDHIFLENGNMELMSMTGSQNILNVPEETTTMVDMGI